MRVAFIAGAVVLSVVASAKAQQEVWILGDGNASCGEYLQAMNDERRARPPNASPNALYDNGYISFHSYVDGFLSGTNTVSGEAPMTGRRSDTQSRMKWLENYCSANPLDKFVNAVAKLRLELIKTGE